MVRQSGALGARAVFEVGEERRALLAADRKAALGSLAVDPTLYVE